MKIVSHIDRNRAFALLASLSLQSAIGLFLGHQYDLGIFLTAGYVVSKGLAPYGIFPARDIFNIPGSYEQLPGIGYPPLWGLYLGLAYVSVYSPTSNIFLYSLAVKLPSILSNIALAFIVERIALKEGVEEQVSKKTFYFFLFNPFMIYISATWGQFDSLVILTSLVAMNDLFQGRTRRSAFLLALSVSLKIIPLVLGPLFLLFIKRNNSMRRNLQFVLIFITCTLLMSYGPFRVFGWDPNIILRNPSYHFQRAGCLTLFNILELLFHATSLPRDWEFLGYMWIPSLLLGYYLLSKTSLNSRMDIYRWASSLLFVLMLSRTWVSEQNVILLIPLIMLHAVVNLRRWVFVQLTWIITTMFTILNATPFQMFFLLSLEPSNILKMFDQSYLDYRLILRFITVIPWTVLGWSYVRETARGCWKR